MSQILFRVDFTLCCVNMQLHIVSFGVSQLLDCWMKEVNKRSESLTVRMAIDGSPTTEEKVSQLLKENIMIMNQNAKSQLRDFSTAPSAPVMACLFMSSPDGLHDDSDTISNFHLLLPRHMEMSYLEITSVVYREWTMCCGHIQSPLSTINTMKVNAQAV